MTARGLGAGTVTEAHRTALVLADAADRIALAHFRGPLSVATKPDGTLVTEADTAIEQALRALLSEAHADHAVFGEETGGGLDPERPTWVIDPIDGTKNFARGVPVFATLIALVVDRHPVVGVVTAPALGERIDGGQGLGVRRNGQPVGVSGIADLADAHVTLGDLDRLREVEPLWRGVTELIDVAWHVRGFGDFWNHTLVACGAAEVAVEREVAPWDIAAPAAIVVAAGGRVTDLRGAPVLDERAPTPNAVVTTNGVLHEAVRNLLS